MTVRTRTDLVNASLKALGVLPAGQAAEPEDFARINDALPDLLDLLDGREVVSVQSIDEIPSEWVQSIADIVAWERRTEFGITGELAVELEKKNAAAVISLKAMNRTRYTGSVANNRYY